MSRQIVVHNFAYETRKLLERADPQELRDAASALNDTTFALDGPFQRGTVQSGAVQQIILTLRNLAAWAELREAMDAERNVT